MEFKMRFSLKPLALTLLSFSLIACSQGFQSANLASSSTQFLATTLDGTKLYNENCASCHGNIMVTPKRDRTFAQINSAIISMPQMSALIRLTPAEVQAISNALSAPGALATCESAPDVGHVAVHRLNNVEYDNTLKQLLGVANRLSVDLSFPSDEFAGNFNNNAKVLSVTPGLMAKYLEGAETAVNTVFANATLRARWITCDPNVVSCTQNILQNFLGKAFRRPPTSGEVAKYVDIFRLAQGEGDSAEIGVKVAMTAALISPNFIYRAIQHPAPADKTRAAALNQYELASRISYFIWSSMPDDELFTAAKNGQLSGAGLATQVRRMLKDAKASALLDQFATQWLQLNHFDRAQPDTGTFPVFTAQLRADLLNETRLQLKDLFDRDGSFFELLTAEHSFLNERLAGHYGISGVTGTQFRKVSLVGTPRIGILTHGSLLTVNANPERTSIVKRGKWVLDNLLCTPPPPPPPEVLGSLPTQGTGLTLRQRMEVHRSNPACFSCHAQMDPIGFALENFDGIGRFRELDGGLPIDNMGEFPDGRKFSGSLELSSTLKDDDKFKVCVAEKIFSFSLGRQPEEFDRCSINRIGLNAVAPDKPISAVVIEMVTSDPFLKQRGE